jgi:uncharacterized membrane protein YhaH (DUF805 family)
MSFPDAVRICLMSKYADFTGRARRSEYWWFTLFTVLVGIVAGIIDSALGLGNGYLGLFTVLSYIALLLPSLAVGARRLHDTSKSGWLLLIGIIPFIGGLILLVLFLLDSHGDNQYGPSPKGAGAAGAPGAGPGGYGYGGPA